MNKIFIFFTTLILVYSCQENLLKEQKVPLSTQEEYSLIALEEDYKLSDEVTSKILIDFISGNGLPSSRSISDIKIRKIDKKLHITPANISRSGQSIPDTTLVCEVEIDQNNSTGFALVIADKRFPGVIAYAEKGSLKDTLENKGLAICLSQLSNYIDAHLKYFNSIKETYLKSALDKTDQNNYGTTTPRTTNGKEDGSFSYHTEKGAFITTLWDQFYPYNKGIYCAKHPTLSAPAGCVAIAVAQIMAYHRHPSSFNWNLLLQSPQINTRDEAAVDEVSRLTREIGSKVHMQYDCEGSSSNITEANSALKSYGYSTDGVKSYDLNTIMTSINNSRPVIIRADERTGKGGHEWIIDAYRIGTISASWGHRPRSTTTTYYGTGHYVHMNFGWGGTCNLWYVVKEEMGSDYPGHLPIIPLDFFAESNHFTDNFKIIPNIRH